MRLLDLFCGAGGAAMGYYRAGFTEIVGVDLHPQPNYPFTFVQDDALDFDLSGFDFIHASPPCQAYSSLKRLGKRSGDGAFDLVAEVRDPLVESGIPYVIENVVGAPLLTPTVLCGSMFGLRVRRHRLFETSFPMLRPKCDHSQPSIGVYGDHPQVSKGMNRARTIEQAQEAMEIDWMPWGSLTQAIPPAFTQFIAEQFIAQLERAS